MKKWLIESEKALERALQIADNDQVPLLNLYILAPLVYAEVNQTNNEAVLSEMAEENERQVKEDCRHDPNSIEQYKFHFVSSYLYGYVVAGKIDIHVYDEVMDFVAMNMDLFSDD